MKAAVPLFPSKAIAMPPSLTPVDICRNSGMIPTEGVRKSSPPGSIVTEYATKEEMPGVASDLHGGIHSHSKEIDQDEWPRAASVVDLTRIRPVTVSSPALLAQSDLYRSVNPFLSGSSGDDDGIKVARATTPDGTDPGVEGTAKTITNSNGALPPGDKEKEVRRAEPVRPMDLPSGQPIITIPVPKPAEF
jgi:hypothetical protein